MFDKNDSVDVKSLRRAIEEDEDTCQRCGELTKGWVYAAAYVGDRDIAVQRHTLCQRCAALLLERINTMVAASEMRRKNNFRD